MSTQKSSSVPQSFLPTREFVTDQQVGACLAVLRELRPYAEGPTPSFFHETPPDRPELDGGIKAAVSVAVMSACERLEKIMRDDSRWDIKGTLSIFKELVATQKAQQGFIREQTAAAHVVQLPHYLLRPELMTDGTHYFAVWGNKDLPGGRIIGRGETPADALNDFDDAFNRAPADQLQLILEQTTPPSDTPE